MYPTPHSLQLRARKSLRAVSGAAAVTALTTVGSVLAGEVTAHAELLPSTNGPIAVVDDAPGSNPDSIECPIPSGSEFTDSWGASRSGGRHHEGVDMVADRGTPIVAVQAGEIHFKNNRLGGKAAWLTVDRPDGGINRFYYAHLDQFVGGDRFVEAGEVIGTVGSTGNANGPHLHFETHFSDHVSNPYPATFDACVAPVLEALAEAEAEANRRAAMVAAVVDGNVRGDLEVR